MRRRTVTPEDRAAAGLPAEGGLPETPPDTSWRDAEVPKSRAEFERMLAKACARNLELASDSKALTDAIKAGTDAFTKIYGEGKSDEPFGTGFVTKHNGAHTNTNANV